MPKAQSADGVLHDFPEGTASDVIDRVMKQYASDHQPPSTLGDVATSFGRGVVKGAIGLAGLPGDVSNMVGRGVEKAGEFLGAKPMPVPELGGGPPSSSDITKKVEGVAGSSRNQKPLPVNMHNRLANLCRVQFVGPGGALTKAATTVAGGLGAEAGGELGGEPGRFVGGLVAGGGTGLAIAEGQSMRLASHLPTMDQIRASARAAYQQVENARLIASQGSLNGLVSATRAGLDQRLITDAVAPRTFRALGQLEDSGGDIGQIMGVRQRLGDINPGAGTDYEAAQHVRDAIDNYIETLPPGEIVQGDPQFTQAMLNHARANWRAYAKLDQVHTAMEIGSHRAAVSGTGANTQNAMRQRIRQILDSDTQSRGFFTGKSASDGRYCDGDLAAKRG